jgi:hypothetical protein
MSKKVTLIEKTAGKILGEFRETFRFGLDEVQEDRFKLYLITRMTMIYNEGYSDGLEKAREIFVGVTRRKTDEKTTNS